MEKNVEYPETSVLWRVATGQKAGYKLSVRKTVVRVEASVWGHCVHVWCRSLRLRNDLCICYYSRYQLSKTYRFYCLNFFLERIPMRIFSVYRERQTDCRNLVCADSLNDNLHINMEALLTHYWKQKFVFQVKLYWNVWKWAISIIMNNKMKLVVLSCSYKRVETCTWKNVIPW